MFTSRDRQLLSACKQSMKHHRPLTAMRTEENIIAGQTKHLFPNGFLGIGNNHHRFSCHSAEQLDCFGFAVAGEKTNRADFHKVMQQHIKQKPADEPPCRQIHRFGTIGITPAFIGKGYLLVGDCLYAVVGDSNPVCESAKTGEDLFRTGKRFLDVDDRIFGLWCDRGILSDIGGIFSTTNPASPVLPAGLISRHEEQ